MTLDIAPFAYREHDTQTGALILRWEEPRNIVRVVLDFADADAAPRPSQVRLHYWRCHWPEHRVTSADLARGAVGSAGWKPRDDWFNGEWRAAHARARRRGGEIMITFFPLARREFPQLSDFDVTYRQTMGLRIDLPPNCCAPMATRVFTDTPLRPRQITVETGCGRASASPWRGEVEVYNGTLQEMRGPQGNDPRLHLSLLCAAPGPLSHDHTIVTLRSPECSVSFRPADLDQGRPIWIRDLGVLAADARWDLRYSEQLAARLRVGLSRYDAISGQPEQTLGRALREQPPKEPMHFIVGCEGGRQKFGIAPNGDLFAHVGFIRRVPGADTERLGWQGQAFALRFGWDDWLRSGRRIARGFLPLHEARFCRGAIDVVAEAFAAPIGQSALAGPILAETPVACLLRLTFVNNGAAPLAVAQRISCTTYEQASVSALSRNLAQGGRREVLRIDGDLVWAAGERDYLRLVIDAGAAGAVSVRDGALECRAQVAPGASQALVLKVPFLGLLQGDEIEALRAKDFEAERAEVLAYWEQRVAGAAAIETPEPDVTDFYRAHLTHILINDEREVGSERRIGRVSSFNYGNYSNEAVMQIMELDRRGLHQEARRHYEVYLRYQGTAPLPGNFRTTEGLFYGSAGYECGGYNQHHGWVLWGLAEHYRFTGDRDWLLEIAPRLIAGCDWVIRERQATMRLDAQGRRVLEYGFLPAGSLEDVTDFHYWLSTNALTARGLSAAAQVLAEVGHPQGERLMREAAAYRADLLAGFREAMVRSPVVALRDGTWVPHHPSRLYWRGRDFGWIREVLEGSINLVTTVLDAQSDEATWILKDYEDNRYLDAPYNYPLDNFEGQWFSRGGFSMQPNLLYFTPPYLARDQVEHFLRAFFNGFAACWRADIRAMTEHPLPTLSDWAGDHFKTSDEAMAAMWLRMMFIQEDGDMLYLGRGLPRAWLGSEQGVAIRNAATYFGPMSLEMRPLDDGQRIVAQIDPPRRRTPQRTVVRFRHPHKARLMKVTVNGAPTNSFDADKEWVVLEGLRDPTVVEAHFLKQV